MPEVDPSALPDGVTLVDGEGGLPAVRVATPAATGEIYLQGAHVTAWTPADAEPVLWLSPHARFEKGTPIRGGVPICAPWFGPGRQKDKPNPHGWMRTAPWTLADASTTGDDVVLRFTLDGADADVPQGQPADVSAEYTVTMGTRLRLALTVTAGADGLDLEDALHAYLAVSDVREVTIEGLGGTRYADKAPGGRAVNAQSGDLRLTRETDRVYGHGADVAVVDPGLARRIAVTKEGSNSTVVWNPWEAKGTALSDIGDAWPRFVCVEVANALAGHVELEPGAAHTTTATYAVTRA